MSLLRPMSRPERAALADAIRHMRKAEIRPRDMIASGVPARSINRKVPAKTPALRRIVRVVR